MNDGFMGSLFYRNQNEIINQDKSGTVHVEMEDTVDSAIVILKMFPVLA